MQNDAIPEWARKEAVKALGVPEDDTGWHHTPDLIHPIARALVAAKRRGLERAARESNRLYEMWRKKDSHAGLSARAITAAIRKLMEGGDEDA